MRPSREIYVRTSRVTQSGVTVEPGVEFRDGDSFKYMENELATILIDADLGKNELDPVKIAEAVETLIRCSWFGRAYFVEVFSEAGGWIQIYQPYGIPRNP